MAGQFAGRFGETAATNSGIFFLRSRVFMNALSIRLIATFGLNVCLGVALAATSCFAQATTVDKSLQTAVSGSGQARYTAIDDLGERHANAAQAVPALQKLLADKDPQVRWRSARALGDYDDQAMGAASAVRGLLKDSDPVVQYHAAVALGRIADKSDETVQALVTAATSKDERVARAAIASLRELEPGRDRVVKALAEVLKSDDEAVVLHAMEAIVERGPEAAPLLVEALRRPETTVLACSAIQQMGPEAKATVPALVEVIRSNKHSKLLIQALLAVASIGPAAEAASPAIVPLLESSTDATVPVAAAYALGSIGAKDAEPALRKAMEKDNPFMQMIAAWAIAKMNPEDQAAMKLAVAELVEGLKSNDAIVRTAAAKALQELKAPLELVGGALVQVMHDKDPEVQANVVDAIASLGESVVPRVAKALERPEMRDGAVRILRQLGPKAAGAVDALIKAAASGDAKFRTEVQMTLGAIGPAAAPATDMLAKSLASNDAGERESALYALRQIGPKAAAATRPLLQCMNTGDTFESEAAAWALARIAPDNPQVSSAVVKKLTAGLGDTDEQIRLESAAALAEMGAAAKAAAPALQRAAKEDASEVVRAAAADALKRVQS
jgi:HEAT repeat protein